MNLGNDQRQKNQLALNLSLSPMGEAQQAGKQAAESRHAVHGTTRADASREQGLLLLSLAFAAIVACNLAFWRHLRRVYASPRRSVWRRG